ncbi:MAG: trypsin-like peptidase domain-containing protein [Methylocystis sp.]|nr:trypsin-like peptidase domain-containing protein [Methylocystis sp.]
MPIAINPRDRAMKAPRRASRLALLGAAAALALGAAIGPAPLTPAYAEAPLSGSVTAAGPASFADIVERVKPAVVAIKVKAVEDSQGGAFEMPDMSPDDPMYRFFKRFGDQGQGRPQKRMTMSQGSGFIISADGYVVTNNHVVEHASEVEVALDDGRTLPAKVIGADKRTDLALLKINDGHTLPYVEWGTTAPRVGDWVIAVGNPFGLGGSVSAGIVSARGRDIGAGPYDDFLQIDAPVNRGNSGGPAFDSHGNVIGVNTAIYSPSGGSIGIGFAIPTEVARDVVAALKEKGSVSRGWIGVKIQNVTQEIADSLGLKSTKGALILGTLPDEREARTDDENFSEQGPELSGLGIEVVPATEVRGAGKEGLLVTDLDPSGAAAQKGVRRGDVIVEAGGQPVNSRRDLAAALDAARKDGRRSVLLRVKSADGAKFVAVPLKGAG